MEVISVPKPTHPTPTGRIPSASEIESAVDVQKLDDAVTVAAKLKELHEAVGDQPYRFQRGFLLGLKTAEFILSERGQKL